MAIIYLSTDRQVPCEQTAALLNEYQAIWCPPPSLRPWHGNPSATCEAVVLVHRDKDKNCTLIGTGTACRNPRLIFGTDLLWTGRDIPGVRPKARSLGYSGPANMSFLRLDGVHMVRQAIAGDAVQFLGGLKTGLNVVTEQEFKGLMQEMNPAR